MNDADAINIIGFIVNYLLIGTTCLINETLNRLQLLSD